MPERRLRGLSSLISSTTSQPPPSPQAPPPPPADQTRMLDIPVSAITPSPKQARRSFDKAALQSLANSIQEHGLLQAVVVRPVGGAFELIAGERRWRAAQLAGLQTIRAVSRPSTDQETLVLSVIENLQREDLDPIEEAGAYRALMAEGDLTHEQIATYVGRDRTTISNTLRLLDLPASIQAKLASGALSAGHARVLLAVTDPAEQARLAERASDGGMSVRQLERTVHGAPGARDASGARKEKAAHLADLERRISERIGVRVEIHEGRRGGRLVARFRTNDEFMRILEALGLSDEDI